MWRLGLAVALWTGALACIARTLVAFWRLARTFRVEEDRGTSVAAGQRHRTAAYVYGSLAIVLMGAAAAVFYHR